MQKAGGLVALIAGILCVFATVGSVLFANQVIRPTGEYVDTISIALGGIFVSIVVIVLSAIVLNVRNPWPGVILIAFSLISIFNNWGGGFVTICLILAIIGGVLTLFGRTSRP